MAKALNAEIMAPYIERTLLGSTGQVRRVTPSALWYRQDGSCSLRYRVSVSAGTAETERVVLARVHPSDASAKEAEGPALSLFPADPDLPTLASAMDLTALSRQDWPFSTAHPISVDVVRHSRQGAAVLRYGVRQTGTSSASPSGQVYGKVYPDPTTGQRVHRFLGSCVTAGRVRIPRSLGYSPRLHLGLTEALPGEPRLPDVVRSGSAHPALHASGRALAALHHIRQASAPQLTIRDLTRELGVQLEVVQGVWPRSADQVRSLLDQVGVEADGADPVLCHGDFTPSQVLLAGDTVCGLVDFDTACWGERAMDLGRFLAHLDLLVTKDRGESAEPIRHRLADSFLSGYADSEDLPVIDESLLGRIALFRSLSLALTALHACRQLKEHRLRLALSLLSRSTSTAHYRPGKAPHENLV